jgi:hypothetical protein
MKVTLTASTGAKILVWREDVMFHARRADLAGEAQVCWAIDLFEVIAELAGLDLEEGPETAEAMRLAASAQRRLGSGPAGRPPNPWREQDTRSGRG